MTSYNKSLIGDNLTSKNCFEFIESCFSEIKILVAENDIIEIYNIDPRQFRKKTQPYNFLYFDDGNIRLYVQKSTIFGSRRCLFICRHEAKWKDLRNRIIDIEISEQIDIKIFAIRC